MMKVKYTYKGKETIYEYPTTTMLVNIETRDKIKQMATKEGRTIKEFVDKLITDYENKSH